MAGTAERAVRMARQLLLELIMRSIVALWLTGFGLVLSACQPPSARADEKLAGIACRSVHLSYPAPESTAFYLEMTPEVSAPGTYFMACGFNVGYFGMQELGNGKKVVLFSVWDPGSQNDPGKVDANRQVQVLFHDPQVRVKRFGGEGTGGQSFFDFDWKTGSTYRFLVTSRKAGDRSVFSGYLYLPEEKQWKRLVTFSTIATSRQLLGFYSFVEDFKRDRVSTTHARRASFSNGWARTLDGTWQSLSTARFSADSNPALNIDAGLIEHRFFLATGGATKNEHLKLGEKTTHSAPDASVPADVTALLQSERD